MVKYHYMDGRSQKDTGPVKGRLPIVPPPADTSANKPNPVDIFFKEVASNLSRVPYAELVSGIPPNTTVVPGEEAKPALEFLMLQEARNIQEQSASPVPLFLANQRNRDLAASGAPPISQGDRVHGMPLQHFRNAGNGILAPEFYGGSTRSYTGIRCSLYVSEITNTTGAGTGTPQEIIRDTHTGDYSLQEGTITVVFDKSTLSKNSHTGTVSGIKPRSVARVVSVGESLTSVKSCIVTNEQDAIEAKKVLSSLQMYIPLYDGSGKLLFTQEEWLAAQKKY